MTVMNDTHSDNLPANYSCLSLLHRCASEPHAEASPDKFLLKEYIHLQAACTHQTIKHQAAAFSVSTFIFLKFVFSSSSFCFYSIFSLK